MKYVIYNLIWENGIGTQPYQTLVPFNVGFDGGVLVKNDTYFGYMHGADEQCVSAISGSAAFNMKELTEAEALNFFSEVVPLNTVQYDELTHTALYAGLPYVLSDSTIKIPWTTTKN